MSGSKRPSLFHERCATSRHASICGVMITHELIAQPFAKSPQSRGAAGASDTRSYSPGVPARSAHDDEHEFDYQGRDRDPNYDPEPYDDGLPDGEDDK